MKKTNPPISRLLLLLLAAGALLAFGVFTNVLTDLWGGDLKTAFANNPWLIAAFALLLGLVGYLYSGLEKPADRAAEAPVDEDQYQKVCPVQGQPAGAVPTAPGGKNGQSPTD